MNTSAARAVNPVTTLVAFDQSHPFFVLAGPTGGTAGDPVAGAVDAGDVVDRLHKMIPPPPVTMEFAS